MASEKFSVVGLPDTQKYGVAIIPEVISGNDDGIELYASEANEIMFRPALLVEYSLA